MSPEEQTLARAAGFLRPLKYGHIERERRWLCSGVPENIPILRVQAVTDIYLEGTTMRLREMIGDDGAVERKLTKKADLSPDRRVITTIYLDAGEFDRLSVMAGHRVRKRRTYLTGDPVVMVDSFEGALAGLHLAEVEFADHAALETYAPPGWMAREVTDDPAYGGFRLAKDGAPSR